MFDLVEERNFALIETYEIARFILKFEQIKFYIKRF